MVSFIDNFILGFALAIVLGPITLEILNRGLKYGFGKAMKTVIGMILAESIYFTIVYLGLTRFAESNAAKLGLGLFGVCFLAYLGFTNISEFLVQLKNFELENKKKVKNGAFMAGFLITFLNPLNILLWIGLIGGFLAQSASLFVSIGVLFGIFTACTAVAIVSLFGNKILSKDKIKYIPLVAGLLLIFYSQKLLYDLYILLK